jgi:guanylate kinase
LSIQAGQSPTRRGFPIVLSAPSGTGKTTLAHLLHNSMDKLTLSVSYTTRPMRGSEQDGVNYHFIEVDRFKEMIQKDEFLEWAVVYDNYYGSGAIWTEENLQNGKLVLFDIDVQGGLQIKKHYQDAVSIFIIPPSFEELEQRLVRRGTETPDKIKKRLQAARDEIKIGLSEYDYVINNEKIDRALFDLTSIIRTHYIKRIDRKKIEQRLFHA